MLNTNQFTFDKTRKTLTAEASSLPDADWSFRHLTIQSVHTGKRVFFEWVKTERDWEGDIMAWVYRPVDKKVNVKTLVIFND